VEMAAARLTGGDDEQEADMTANALEAWGRELSVGRSEAGDEPRVPVPWWHFCLKIGCTVSLFVILSFLLEHFADSQVTAASRELMRLFGLPGLFICVFLADGLPQPFSYLPLIFFAVKGSSPGAKPVVFAVCASASYTAALIGYGMGWQLRRLPLGSAAFGRLSAKYPFVPDLMSRRGAVAVAVVAALPIPLAAATWTAGSFRVRFPTFMVACLMRLPKVALFVALSRCTQEPSDQLGEDSSMVLI